MNSCFRLLLGPCAGLLLAAFTQAAETCSIEPLATNLTLIHGPINGVRLEAGGKSLAIYGDPRENPPGADRVLFTHVRRDVAWAARGLVNGGAIAVVPKKEEPALLHPEGFWRRLEQGRFHNYSQPCTKVLVQAFPVAEVVRPGGSLTWEGIPIRVLDTPGYTPGAVTYLASVGSKKVAFTGDLIYGDGRIPDLYSFQDVIPETRTDGYHGYAARLGDLVGSLRRLAAEQPDQLVPDRGPVIEHPSAAIETLLNRVQALYSNYVTIDALRWYFGDGHILAKARRVLGPQATVDWMPMAETNALPGWVKAIDNTRLILSADGSGFLVDCGSAQILDQLKRLRQAGTLASIDQVWVTHYHDDHTDQVSAEVAEFGSTVLACRELWDILERPGDYFLPCLTRNPIAVSGRLTSGAHWRWKEFEMTAWYFPGQTLYHQALLVRKDGAESILFVGDSFTPTGIDDYCLQNRNFLHPGTGYFQCLSRIETLPPGCWLVNQHVEPMFRFSPDQLRQMRSTLERRVELLRVLFPWDDPNYGLDECWARIQPYCLDARAGQPFSCRAVLFNHSPQEAGFEVRPNLPKGWTLASLCPARVRVPPGQEGAVAFTVLPAADTPPGLYVLTADVRTPQGEFKEWMEAMVNVAGSRTP